MAIVLSNHARLVSQERGLPIAWIEATILAPDRRAKDPTDPVLTRSYRRIPQANGRILRVVHRPAGPDILVITAFLDRGATL